MPRLHGYRERRFANFYDALLMSHPLAQNCELSVKHRDLLGDAVRRSRLFGNENIGTSTLTNMSAGGVIAGDQTFVVMNVYARTNLFRGPVDPDLRKIIGDMLLEGRDEEAIATLRQELPSDDEGLRQAFYEWAHATLCTLVIGDKPILELTAFDMLRRRQQIPVELIGRVRPTNAGAPPGDLTYLDPETGSAIRIDGSIGLPRAVVIPVRQSVSVIVDNGSSTRRNLSAVLPSITPAPAFWVHLEGLQTRDVA